MHVGKALLLTHLKCIRSHSLASSLWGGGCGESVGILAGEVVCLCQNCCLNPHPTAKEEA